MFGPVVIGLSSRSLMNVTRKYIEVDLDSITNGTSVLISTKVQCSTLLSCQSCLVQDHCQWCGDQCLYQGQQKSSMNSTECSKSCDSNVYYGTKVKFSQEQIDRYKSHVWCFVLEVNVSELFADFGIPPMRITWTIQMSLIYLLNFLSLARNSQQLTLDKDFPKLKWKVF